MYKLILHHTYKLNGEAVDVSGSGNHGERSGASYVPDGRAPGTGALFFEGFPDHKVVVRPSLTLTNLRAIKVEAWIRPEDLDQRRNIVEGHLAFAFFIHPDGVLWGTFYDPDHLTPPTPGSDPSWPGVNSDAAFAPDGHRHTVPLECWSKVTFTHDGVAVARLYIDDVLVGANYNLRSSVGSVGSFGLRIGQWPDAARYTFKGHIDEVKLWRYDPDAAAKAFFCRPMTPQQFACWKRNFDWFGKALEGREGHLMAHFIVCIMRAQEELVRNVRSRGEEAIKQQEEFAREYLTLRCEGKLDGGEMRHLLRRWAEWMAGAVEPEAVKQWRDHLEGCMQEYEMLHDPFKGLAGHLLVCDPEFVRFLEMIWQEWASLDLWEKPPGYCAGCSALLRFIESLVRAFVKWIRGIFKKP